MNLQDRTPWLILNREIPQKHDKVDEDDVGVKPPYRTASSFPGLRWRSFAFAQVEKDNGSSEMDDNINCSESTLSIDGAERSFLKIRLEEENGTQAAEPKRARHHSSKKLKVKAQANIKLQKLRVEK